MTHSNIVQTASAPPLTAQSLVRWIATNNPFYVISAGLFLAGLWISFPDASEGESTWALMAGLTGYTLLLASTAFLLVRFCNDWDDVRTVLLLVVLMFLATSGMFDSVLVTNVVNRARDYDGRFLGCGCFLGGLLFAIAISECLLRGIRLGMRCWLRVPYYLILALFFLYPLALSPVLDQPRLDEPRSEALLWGVFGFSSAAGLVFLTLIPAIRRGPGYSVGNGSPWRWPLYPWALFGLLACAVPARAFLLCWSMIKTVFAQDLNQLVFGPYFLVPFGLALTVLLLEFGLALRKVGRPSQAVQLGGLLQLALIAPAGLATLTLVGHRDDPIYGDFLTMFHDRLGGDPLFVTLLAASGFYFYAMLRRVSLASEALTATLAVLSVVGPNALAEGAFIDPQPLPILAAAVLQLGLGLWRQRSWRCLFAACLAAATILAVPPSEDTWFLLRAPIAFHVGLFAILLISEGFDDTLARQLRMIGPGLATLCCFFVIATPLHLPASLPTWTQNAYAPIMAGILLAYGLLPRRRTSLVLAGLVLVVWMGEACWRGYGLLRQMIAGLDYMVLSLTLFVLAVLISLGKAGILSRRISAQRDDVAELTE